ncbi:MAG: hypothetical protein H7174_12915 [Flavobacterium sp.]|nr:hypothetical protein [Flavobacterium sp.]
MKKIILIFVINILAFSVNAQISNLIVSSNPPSKIATWSGQQSVITLIVTGNQAVQENYKIKTEILTSDGTVIGKTDLTRSRSFVLTSGNTRYSADDVLPLEYMIFNGIFQNALNKSGRLPSDSYQICTQLVNAVDYAPLETPKCKSFNVAAMQLPVLMKPSLEEVLDAVKAKSAIIFRWTPVVPKPNYLVIYKLLVFEVLQGQNSTQAIRSNFPILEQNISGTTQFIWTPLGILKDTQTDDNDVVVNKKLVYTIQTFDEKGEPLSDGSISGDGVSEPSYFFIANEKKAVKE